MDEEDEEDEEGVDDEGEDVEEGEGDEKDNGVDGSEGDEEGEGVEGVEEGNGVGGFEDIEGIEGNQGADAIEEGLKTVGSEGRDLGGWVVKSHTIRKDTESVSEDVDVSVRQTSASQVDEIEESDGSNERRLKHLDDMMDVDESISEGM